MTISEFVGRYFSTRKCAACGELLPYEMKDKAFCEACEKKWEIAKRRECRRCGRAVCECICMTRILANSGALCHHKVISYSSGVAVAHNTVMFIKRNKNLRVSSYLAAELAAVIRADRELPTLDTENTVVTFVPRGRKGVLKYGVDQSELLSSCLADMMGLSHLVTLTRVRGGKEQKRLSAAQRAKNVKKLYAPTESLEADVAGKNVIIIDDIVTTGASIGSSAMLIHALGAKEIIGAALSVAYKDKSTNYRAT